MPNASTTSGRWLSSAATGAGPARLVICVPYAGATGAAFRDWMRAAPQGIQVRALQVPGRGARQREPGLSDLRELSDRAADALARELVEPVILFGHSLGALVAYQLARRLSASGPRVAGLVVSGCRSPENLPRPRSLSSEMSDDALTAELARLGGAPPEVLANRSLMQVLLPIVRGDLAMLETYVADPSDVPLSCPIEALGGDGDQLAPPAQLRGWHRYTSAGFGLTRFPGGHFFLHERSDAVLSRIATLARAWSPEREPAARCAEDRVQ